MNGLLRKGVTTVLGVAVVLGWWTIRGWFEGKASAESSSHIPAMVWDGGGGRITVEAESSDPGTVSASFETNLPMDNPNHKFLETWQKVAAGSHRFSIEVPPSVGGTVGLNIENPKVGSSARITVKLGDRVVAEDALTLDAPLKPGYGFGVQVALDDYATGKRGED
jgi:hypothetical protein